MKTISIVLPVFNEEDNIAPLYAELVAVFSKLPGYAPQLVFVNDGSKDSSGEKIARLAENDSRVSYLLFSRNFGHQAAVTAGIDHANGDAVIIMDTDLQDPPAAILDLVAAWEKGNEVVHATRKSRKDTWFKSVTAHFFYRLMNLLSDIPIPEDTGDFRLIDRRVVAELRKFREHSRFMRGLASFVGFRQTRIYFDRDARMHGETKYPFSRMLRFSLDAITGFSTVPLRLITAVGFLISGGSAVAILYVVLVRIFSPATAVPGWTFIAVVMLFVGGVQMLMLGIIGSYVGRIYDESRARPLYIVAERRNLSVESDPASA